MRYIHFCVIIISVRDHVKRSKLLAFAATFAIMTSTLAPVYANEADLDITGMLDEDITLGLSVDDVTKESQGDWWKLEDGTLTLFGQLPDTGEI